jgi:ribosomal protein S7
MTRLKKNKTIIFKDKIVNVLMINGGKHTSEKILLKSSKLLQKSSKKKFQNLMQLAIINATSTFKLNEQIVKKSKRKSKEIIPLFILRNSLRTMTALKYIKTTVCKKGNSISFHKILTKQILASYTLKGQSVEQKTKLQIQILLNKRYLSKFKW